MVLRVGANVSGFDRIITGFKRNSRGLRGGNLRVGYSAPYAIYVHERLDLHHPNGQAKFLEIPARRDRSEILRIIAATWRATKNMVKAMLDGGHYLLRRSKELVPVKTGRLRSSGYVYVERK